MRTSIWIVATLFSLTAASSASGDQLGDDVVPVMQSVRLQVDPSVADYSGSTTIGLDVRSPSSSLRLHAEEMEIDSVALFSRGFRDDVKWSLDPEGLLRIETSTPLPTGPATLMVTFRNELGTQAVGLYKTVHEGNSYAFTFFEPNDAREAFPSFDEPRFKIPFQISIELPERYQAVSNTPVLTTTSSDGWNVVAFQPTKPLPTYLLQISIGEFDSVPIEGLGVPGNVVVPRGKGDLATIAAEMTPPILSALEDWFGMPYPYEKLDLIAVPEFWAGAMEQPGAVTFADSGILLDPETASAGQKSYLGMVIAHELAHMWFGNLVTMEWWDDLWLNESFADWMGDRIANEVFPEYQRALGEMWSTQSVMDRDARPSTPKVRQPIENADEALSSVGIAYEKGQAILRMFEGWLGEETFQRGIRHYLRQNAWGNATAGDLWDSLEEVSGKDVSATMAPFVDQTGFPLIRVTMADEGTARLAQERFHNAGAAVEPQSWIIPLQLKTSTGGRVDTLSVLLDEASKDVALEGFEPDWIFPNAGGVGYYRWITEEENLRTLSGLATDFLTPAERISFLGNLSSLLDAGVIGSDLYLDVLLHFADDPEPQVITGLVGMVAALEMPLVTEELEDEYAVYVRRVLGPALDRYGVNPRAGEPEVVSLVRPRLWALLADEGKDPAVLAEVSELAAQFGRDPSSVDATLGGTSVVLSVRNDDAARFEEVIERFEKARNPSERRTWLGAIGSFKDPDLQRRALEYALSGAVRPPEISRIVGGVTDTAQGRNLAWDWLRTHFDEVTARFPAPYISFMPSFAGGCSEGRLKEAREFFSEEAHRGEGTDARLAEVTEAVMDCVNMRNRERENLSDYLRSFEERSVSGR